MGMSFHHSYSFDPAHGMDADRLLAVPLPEAPEDFTAFWQKRCQRARQTDPRPQLRASPMAHPDWDVMEISYRSTGEFPIHGWLLLPRSGPVRRGLVVAHGYGGRDAPDFDVPVTGTALIFPCCRGLSRSARPPISTNPAWHVLHDIDKRDDYVIGGCVEDIWLAASALVMLYPWLSGRIGYSGISFGGGIGALAVAFDDRFDRAHFEVPTFGNQPLWLSLPSIGSAASVQAYNRRHGNALSTMRYYDSASAAAYIRVPTLVAAALFDPAVAPPCQFSVYNALSGRKEIFILDAGHFDYPGKGGQAGLLRARLEDFFGAS
ncbi:acetylxylan esterase [Ensifer soli]|uniref:acetylxylan esterase n=1 Tax=Ciceribacter sp. sgz301302 TaxID=3342379 RepID=UPI0035B7BA6A